MLRFLARLSGRRRHVRRSGRPGGAVARAVVEETEKPQAAPMRAAASAAVAEAAALETSDRLEDRLRPRQQQQQQQPQQQQQEQFQQQQPQQQDHHHQPPLQCCSEDGNEHRSWNLGGELRQLHHRHLHEHHLRYHYYHHHHHHHHLHHHHHYHHYHPHYHHHSHSHQHHLHDLQQRVLLRREEERSGRSSATPLVRSNTNPDKNNNSSSSSNNNSSAPSSVTTMTRGCNSSSKIPPYLATLLILSYTLFGIAEACSSRSTPKPRPPTPTPRPNITFHTYTCPPDYAEWYCLNGATCFTVKIVDSLLYNCLCVNGYIGQRCEFKDLDGSYLPSRQRVMLETASIAGGATIAVFLVVIICVAAYIHCKRKQKELRTSNCFDTVDGPTRDPELRPFSNRSRSLMIYMAKNPNSSTTIEQTRMPGWSRTTEPTSVTESLRMAPMSEGKRSNQ